MRGLDFAAPKPSPCVSSPCRLTFRHAARTVMDTKEPLMRSDWAIYRGGRFSSRRGRLRVEDSFLTRSAATLAFRQRLQPPDHRTPLPHYQGGRQRPLLHRRSAGDAHPLFHNQSTKLEDLDRTPGPKTRTLPANCLVDDCLISLTGRVEKQTAGVQIQLAQSIRPPLLDLRHAAWHQHRDGSWDEHHGFATCSHGRKPATAHSTPGAATGSGGPASPKSTPG